MAKVIRVSFNDPEAEGCTAVVLQEGSVVLDLRDEFRSKRLLRPLVIQIPKDAIELMDLDDITYS